MKLFLSNTKKSKAQAMAEFALALPVVLLIVYGLIETGRLLFIYSSVNNASRQAVRYGSTTGDNASGDPRYMDCAGIKETAQRADFLNAFDDNDIKIYFDQGINVSQQEFCTGPSPDPAIKPHLLSGSRVTVAIDADFTALLPNIVPFLSRTVAGGNPITAISSRTLLQTIVVEPDLEDSETEISSVSPSPSEIGETVTIIVTVTGPTLTPVGYVNVTASDGTTCSPVKIELSNGTGFCDMVFSTSDTITITAAYEGDFAHRPSSDTFSHMVNLSSTITSISAHTPNPSQVGQSVSVTVSVSGGVTTPTGSVDITGADTNCSISFPPGISTGSCNVTFSSAGVKTLTATYSGGTDHDVSSNTKTHHVILDDQTVTTITADNPDSSQVGQVVNVFVTVAGVTTPTGTVAITTSDGDDSCTISLSPSGSGNCPVTFNSVGPKTIFATYAGDGTLNGSSSSEPHAVDLPSTVTTITAHTPNPSTPGQPVAVTVTVTGGATTPTGTVAITGAGTNCTITLASGTGSCNATFNATGNKTLNAAYSGDGSHAASNGQVSHTVSSTPPVGGCDSLNVVNGFLQTSGNTMRMSITNNLTSALEIGSLTVTWHNTKGHTGADKTLRLIDASLADAILANGTSFWTGEVSTGLGPSQPIAPNPTTYVPASATSTFIFTFHQSYDNKDGTERVYITFSTPGCEGFYIDQN